MQRVNGQQRQILMIFRPALLLVLCLLLLAAVCDCSAASGGEVGHQTTLSRPPSRIVSLVPGVTEIVAALKADQSLVGITYHTIKPARLGCCAVVGGFMAPSLERIKALSPDLVFISSIHENLRDELTGMGCRVVEVTTTSLAKAYANIELVGQLVGKSSEAAWLVADLKRQLALISRKVKLIPLAERRRVMCLMECNEILVPGDDSFQNELIAAAGGIPPAWGKKGAAVSVDEAMIRAFDPQLIYAYGSCRQKIREFFSQPAWAEMVAVRTDNILFPPNALICRAATHLGDFVGWLAATIYPDHFSLPENMLLREEVKDRRTLALDFDYIKNAEVVETTIADFNHRTLVVDLAEPMQILSTLEGLRQGITTVGNHYLPPSTWNLVHRIGSVEFEERVGNLLKRHAEKTSLLFTGADMKYLVQQSASFKEMKVTALVTAGVSSNAVRMGAEEGRYYEPGKFGKSEKPGTINIILLSNMRLTPRAMTRAIISACEGKSAALQDLDIRSSSNPAFLQATGTGTDNVIVVEGRGRTIEHTGGHSKMGELIARVVYEGVVEAVRRQNGVYEKRSLFHRLQERRVTVYDFLKECRLGKGISSKDLVAPVEELLLDRRYASFVESSLALSDAWQRHQINDLGSFRAWCCRIAGEIAGHPLKDLPSLYSGADLPEPLQLALEALVYGLNYRGQTANLTR
ncbi:MAG: adenosylcobinamide amidohydrolase [Deltaproteobacteria bacterium]|nr:adenosylcobinamide amidohydrolase [Candidatus Tharpella sp.]